MAQTNAQRQAAYREKKLKSEESNGMRLNCVINIHAKYALDRLASCYCVTQQEMLERLINNAERDLFDSKGFSSKDQTAYYDKKLKF